MSIDLIVDDKSGRVVTKFGEVADSNIGDDLILVTTDYVDDLLRGPKRSTSTGGINSLTVKRGRIFLHHDIPWKRYTWELHPAHFLDAADEQLYLGRRARWWHLRLS